MRVLLLFFFIAIALSFFSSPASAQSPGDPCSTAGAYVGRNISGTYTMMVCDGANYQQIIASSDGTTTLQFANDTGSCTSTKNGTVRYNSTTYKWDYCDGTDWQPFPGCHGSYVFGYTGSEESLVIPQNMAFCTYRITVKGASGGATDESTAVGGAGGGTQFEFIPGEAGTLYFLVGEGGTVNNVTMTYGDGGWSYGGGGGAQDAGGGGASAVRWVDDATSTNTILCIAGGGGGSNRFAHPGGTGGSINGCGGNTDGPNDEGGCSGVGGESSRSDTHGDGGDAGSDGYDYYSDYSGGPGYVNFNIGGGGAGANKTGGGGGYGGGGGTDYDGGGGGGGYLNTGVVEAGYTSVAGTPGRSEQRGLPGSVTVTVWP